MSSHHIVRDKQEPALLVLGTTGFSGELLGQLLEWSPTVIATDQTAEALDVSGTKIDRIVSNEVTPGLQSNIGLILPGSITVIEAALNHLLQQGYYAVNIVTAEFRQEDYMPYAGKIDMVIFYRCQKISVIRSGFSKWKVAGEVIDVLTPAPHLHTEGLELIEAQKFKTVHNGLFTIRFNQPFIMLAEAL